MLLVRHSEGIPGSLSETERQSLLEESIGLANQLHAQGQYIDAAPLHSSSTAATVKVRSGKALVTDGPYAETHEQVGGYFMVEAENLQEAVAIASRIPGARIGTVEVRPVREVEGLPKR